VPEAAAKPAKLGRYRLMERIAVGGMAEVYRASAESSHGIEKVVAIKRILPHLAKEPEFVEMFIDEARLMVQLSHPKIVQVLEFGEEQGELFMALELVEGIDLLALLRTCVRNSVRLPVPLAMFIAAEILDALEYAHTAVGGDGKLLEVVHRDISPSNIFIARRGYVKLGDFGIARVVEHARESKTQGTTLKGKYGYMAPEQVAGAPLDARADVFAVGIVLAEMLVGRRLFTAPNELDVLLMVRDANLERLNRYGADLAPDVRGMLDTALARSPVGRYPTAAAFRDSLLEYLFRFRHRVGHAELAKFLDTLPLPGAVAPPAEASIEDVAALDGPQTNAAREEAASIRRNLQAAARDPEVVREAAAIDEAVAHAIDGVIRPTPAKGMQLERPPEVPGSPDLEGDLVMTSPAKILSRLAAELETGMLVMESGDVVKEIYLVRGVPEFVTSNAPNERLGEYLVAHGVISSGELSMVLAILPRFNGKMGDTLVGLGLMRPLDVFRHLTRQVRDKIIDVFSWTHGSFRYYRGRVNTKDAFPLRLDPWEIIGAAVATLHLEPVRERLLGAGTSRVKKMERVRPLPEDFRLGTGPRELWQRLDGKRTVAEWLRRYEEPEQHLTLCRTLYLLIETDLAVLD
jgi:eukaryotic-like serine/threonine-protein kinase